MKISKELRKEVLRRTKDGESSIKIARELHIPEIFVKLITKDEEN